MQSKKKFFIHWIHFSMERVSSLEFLHVRCHIYSHILMLAGNWVFMSAFCKYMYDVFSENKMESWYENCGFSFFPLFFHKKQQQTAMNWEEKTMISQKKRYMLMRVVDSSWEEYEELHWHLFNIYEYFTYSQDHRSISVAVVTEMRLREKRRKNDC